MVRSPQARMQKQTAIRMAVRRAEGAWDSPGRIASSGPSSKPQSPASDFMEWPWKGVLEGAQRQLDHFISLEPKVLKGRDPEAIHDMRVASRRLQQVLDLLYPQPRTVKVRKVRRRVRRSRRALSAVRNCDVLLERARRVLARKHSGRREVWTAFREYVEERRERSFRKASRRLARLNLPALYVRLQEQMEPPPATGQADGPRAAVNLRQRLNESLAKAWSSLERCVEQARETPETASLHAARIAAKRARYLIEVIDDVSGGVSGEFGVTGSAHALACLRRLQRHLGDWHDLEVLEEMMLEMVARNGFLMNRLELAMEVERLVLRNRKSKSGFVEQFLSMTGTSEEWQRLGAWVREFVASGDSVASEPESQSPVLASPRA